MKTLKQLWTIYLRDLESEDVTTLEAVAISGAALFVLIAFFSLAEYLIN